MYIDDCIEKFITLCAKNNIIVEVSVLYRSLEEQARLWAQSRSHLIERKIVDLKKMQYYFLAEVLENTTIEPGECVTNNCCGESWHNFGLAFDAEPVGVCSHHENWLVMGLLAEELGIVWGGRFKKAEYGHFQVVTKDHPFDLYAPHTMEYVLRKTRERYGE